MRLHVPEVLLGVGLALHSVLLTYFASRLWFRGDDWDFLMSRGTVPGASNGWFPPHADHWQTGVVAIYRLLFPFFGMRYYLPYGLVVIVGHVVVCALVYLVLVRLGASRWVALVTTWLLAFLGAGAETFLWDTPMGNLAVLSLGLGSVLVVSRADLGRRETRNVWIMLSLGLTFYGAGITMVVFVALYALFRHGLWTAVRLAAVPAAVFLVWYVAIGHTGSEGVAGSFWDYLEIPKYVWKSLTYALETAAGIPGSGPVLLLVLGVTPWVARGAPDRLRQLALAGMTTAVLQLALAFSTPNRLLVGETWVKSGRYAYLTIVFLVPAIALFLGLVLPALRQYKVAAAGFAALLLAVYTVNALDLEHQYYVGQRPMAEYWPARMSAIVEAVDDGQKVLTVDPVNWLDKGMDPNLVTKAQIRDTLPSVAPTVKARLDAEINYFVAVGPKTLGLFNPTRMTSAFGFPPDMPQAEGCHTVTSTFERPALELESSEGVEIGVESDSTEITTQIVRDGVKSVVRTWSVKPGEVHIATSAKDATLVVGFNRPGDYLICKH
ncbi:MAG: hypothetical protein ABWX96_10200 [Propionibacteriaceae bacterium]